MFYVVLLSLKRLLQNKTFATKINDHSCIYGWKEEFTVYGIYEIPMAREKKSNELLVIKNRGGRYVCFLLSYSCSTSWKRDNKRRITNLKCSVWECWRRSFMMISCFYKLSFMLIVIHVVTYREQNRGIKFVMRRFLSTHSSDAHLNP